MVATGNTESALRVLREAAALMQGDPVRALKLVEGAGADFSNTLPFLLIKAISEKNSGRLRDARRTLQRALDLHPADIDLRAMFLEVEAKLKAPLAIDPLDNFSQLNVVPISELAEVIVVPPYYGIACSADAKIAQETAAGMSNAEIASLILSFEGKYSECEKLSAPVAEAKVKKMNFPPRDYTKKPASDCGLWKSIIEKQLSAWNGSRFTKNDFDETMRECTDFFWVGIKGNRISSASKPRRVLSGRMYGYLSLLEETMSRYRIPDMELIISTTDLPATDHQQPSLDVPVFSFCGRPEVRSLMIPFPRFARDDTRLLGEKDYPWEQWPSWEINRAKFEAINNKWEWDKKKPSAFFAGGLTSNDDVRLRYCEHAKIDPERFEICIAFKDPDEAKFINGTSLQNKVGWTPMCDYPRYRYMLHLDGVSASERLRYLLAMNSVVLKHESSFMEFFYTLLVPGEHYVPLRKNLSDLPVVLDYLDSHESAAKKISANAQKFIAELLSYDSVLEYMRDLLLGYRELQGF